MKRKITLLLLAAASVVTVNAQVLFQENFTSPFNPATAGWDASQNLSAPVGTLSPNWFQGNTTQMTALSGAAADYFAVDFRSTAPAGTTNTISAWLITPTVNLVNGAVFQFATRSGTNPAVFADRMQLYVSTAGTGSNVGTVAPGAAVNTAGTFTTLLLDINPNLTTVGYPSSAWGIYNATVTGLAAPTVGRFAFRYYVPNGGNLGSNSNYVGIDDVKYSLPCDQPTLALTQSTTNICSGSSVSLTSATSGTVAVASYTWSNGSNTSSVIVTPTATTIYTLSATSTSGCVGSSTVAITVTVTPTVVVPSYTVCSAASTTTVMATGATTYSWSTGATTSSVVVSPSTNTFYTVVGYGAGGNCPSNTATTNITLSSSISVNVSSTSMTLCSGRVATLTASGPASSYTWATNPTVVAPTITVNPSSTTTYSVGALVGSFPNVCVGGNTITINVIASPTLSVVLNPTTVCSDGNFTVTTSGASTYTYVLSATAAFTDNPIELTAPIVQSITPTGFVIGGTGANGCVVAGNFTLNVNPNPTVTAAPSSPTVCTNNTVTLTGTGADSYAWSGATTATSANVTYSSATTGTKNFTLTGTSLAGCTGTITTSVNVVACNTNTSTVGIGTIGGYSETSVFPNPFTSEIKIDALDGNVVIFNAIGQVVIAADVHSSTTINTSELPKGVYMVKAYNATGELIKTTKLIKN